MEEKDFLTLRSLINRIHVGKIHLFFFSSATFKYEWYSVSECLTLLILRSVSRVGEKNLVMVVKFRFIWERILNKVFRLICTLLCYARHSVSMYVCIIKRESGEIGFSLDLHFLDKTLINLFKLFMLMLNASCGLSEQVFGSLVGHFDATFVWSGLHVDPVELAVLVLHLGAHVDGHVAQVAHHRAHLLHVLLHLLLAVVVRDPAKGRAGERASYTGRKKLGGGGGKKLSPHKLPNPSWSHPSSLVSSSYLHTSIPTGLLNLQA